MPKESRQIKAQRAKNDEFYTPAKSVYNIFTLYLKDYDFTDKIIYCPCDSEKSEFVKYIKSHKNELKYKEFIYTWDDFNIHKDLFHKADIIITNPPFTKLVKEFIPILNECNKDFFIYGAKISLRSYCMKHYKYVYKNFRFIEPIEIDSNLFNTPNNEQKRICIVYITNIKSVPYYNKKFEVKKDNKISDVIEYSTGLHNYDRMNKIAYQQGEFLVPSSVLCEHYKYMFDILGVVDFHYQKFSDGKDDRYVRVIAKFKDEYLKNKI